ncbi:hypothetical protein DFP73DRAFT_532552 [Morchella snyderi]|nr:hypothetical protein DFP73DRAFT_532552 [Morchella snyderi]
MPNQVQAKEVCQFAHKSPTLTIIVSWEIPVETEESRRLVLHVPKAECLQQVQPSEGKSPSKDQKQKTARWWRPERMQRRTRAKGEQMGPQTRYQVEKDKDCPQPFPEEEEYDLEEFLPSEDDEELGQGPPAERREPAQE